MKKKKDHATDAESLRQKAEERLKKQQSKTASVSSEADKLKLIHELEVHQIELEMQNEELVIAKEKAELAEEKYTALYDFAPCGYLSLSNEGKITEINFAAAKMLGKERLRLIKRQLVSYLSHNTRSVFNLFLEKVFASKVKQSCEVTIATEGSIPIYVTINGIVSQNDENCFLTLIDITDRKQAEQVLKERVKELDCISQFSKLAVEKNNIDDILNELTYLLKKSFSVPEITEVRIKNDGITYQTDNFRETPFMLQSDIIVEQKKIGIIEIAILQDKKNKPVTFLEEEYKLLQVITERLNSIIERLEINKTYKLLSENISDGIILIEDDKIKYVSPGYAQLLGRNAEELKQIKLNEIFSFIHQEDKERIRNKVYEVHKNQVKNYRYEYRTQKANGEYIWVEDALNSEYDENGNRIRTIIRARDITDRKQAEQALQESEEKYRSIFEKGLTAVLVANDKGDYQAANPAAANLFGYTVEELINMNIANLKTTIEPAAAERYEKYIEKGEETGEFEFINKKGQEKLAVYRAVRIKQDFNLSMLFDITDRKQAEQALQESEAKYRELFEANTDGIAIFYIKETRIPSNFVDLNANAAQTIGYTKDELLKLNPLEIEIKTTDEQLERRISELQKNGNVSFETKMFHKNGQLIDVEIKAVVINYQGQFAIMNITRDITDRKQTEEKLLKTKTILDEAEKISNIGSFEYDIPQNEFTVSQGWQKMHGMNKKVLKMDELMPLAHPNDREKIKKAFDSALKNMAPYDLEHQIIRQTDNETRIIKVRGKLIFEENGKPFKMYGSVDDITDRKQAEQALQESEAKLSQILNAFSDPIYVINPDYTIFYANKAMEKMIGTDKIGKKCYKSLYNRDEKCTGCVYDKLIEKRELIEYDIEMKETGQYRNIRNVIIEDNRKLTIYHDITDRKQAEERIKLNSQRLDDLLELSQQSINDKQQIFDYALHTALKITKSEYGFVHHYNESEQRFYLNSWSDSVLPDCKVIEKQTVYELKDTGLWGEVVRQRKPIMVNDLSKPNPLQKGFPTGHVPIKRFLSVPFIVDNKIVAVVAVANKTETYDNEDVVQLNLLMETVWNINNLKIAEEALKESEEKYRLITENASDVIWILNLTKEKYTYISPSVYNLRGYTPEEAMQQDIHQSLTPESAKEVFDSIGEILSQFLANPDEMSKKIHRNELRQTCKDGSIIWIETTTRYQFNSNNEVEVIGISRNIDDRKQAEQALKESEEKHRRLFETMTQGVVYHDAEGAVISANPAAERILGLSIEQMQNRLPMDPRWKIINEDGTIVPGTEYPVAVALRTKSIFGPAIIGVFHPEKKVNIWTSITVQPLFRTGETKPFRVYAVFEDISDRKQAEQALQEKTSFLSTIMETSPVGIVTIDKTGNITYANHRAEQILGLVKDEITSLTYDAPLWKHTDLDGSPFPEGKLPFNLVKKSLNTVLNIQHGITWPDGTIVLLSVNASPIKDNTGEFNGMIASFEDITDRKKAEEAVKNQNLELQKLNATKDKFFSIISHDLKNPFNSMLSFSESLANEYHKYDDAKRQEFISTINDSVKQTYKLLETLLVWSRSQTGRIKFNPQEVDIESIAMDNIQLLSNSTKAKNIHVKKELTPGILVNADIEMLNTVFRNLISNAVKFSPVGGEITVGTKVETPGTVTCYVKDNGLGIESKNIKKLFQVDKNFSTPGTKNEKGTGLGLILCKEFVDKHNGEIGVDSQPGEGSTFYFKVKTLPKKSKTADGCIAKSEEFCTLILTNEPIKKELADVLLPVFKETKGKYSVAGIKKFTELASSIGTKYEVSQLNFMAEKINHHMQIFDIPKINNCFEELEKIFEKAEII